jgi:hypothetical protein
VRFGWLAVVVVACSGAPRKIDPQHSAAPPAETNPTPEPATDVKQAVRRPVSLEVLGLEVNTPSGTSAAAVRVAARMTAVLRAEAREYRAIHVGVANKELFDEKLISGCTTSTQCLVGIGRRLGVDQLLYGTVNEKPDGFHISLTLFAVNERGEQKWTAVLHDFDPDIQAAARYALSTLVAAQRAYEDVWSARPIAGRWVRYRFR